MRYEELQDYPLRSRLEGVIALLPLQNRQVRYQIREIWDLEWAHGEVQCFCVQLNYESWALRGLVLLFSGGGIFLPDAATSFFWASGYTDMKLEQYNAGHDPRYKGM